MRAWEPGPACTKPHFAQESCLTAQYHGLHDHGLQSRPDRTKYRYAARAWSSAVCPWPKRRRSSTPIWNIPRYWPFCARRPIAGLAPRDAERLAAVVAEDVTDGLDRRVPQARDGALLRGPGAPLALCAGPRRVGAGSRERVACRDEPEPRFLTEARVPQQPAVVLEEANDGRARLHRAEVMRELGRCAAGRAGARDDGSRAENGGAQADDNGFQDVPPQWRTGSRRAPQSGSRGEARRCRSCLWSQASLAAQAQVLAGLLTKPSKRLSRSLPTGATAACPS